MALGSHKSLYKTEPYVPPSVVRAIDKATVSAQDKFGEKIIHKGDLIAQVSNQASMAALMERELQSKDIYLTMKNKALYSHNVDLGPHMSVNQL